MGIFLAAGAATLRPFDFAQGAQGAEGLFKKCNYWDMQCPGELDDGG
jgi:hypothetical protein